MKGKLSRKAIAAIAVTLGGSMLIAYADSFASGAHLYGDMLALIAAIAVAVYVLIGRVVRESVSTPVYTYMVYAACAVVLVVLCLFQGHGMFDFGMSTVKVGFLLAIFSTILGHSIFSWCLKFILGLKRQNRRRGAGMENTMETTPMKIIARIRTEFPEKFGIPRQSGLVEELRADIIFEPEYRNPDALRGIEEYSHLWLIWQFSEAVRENWLPTVRPPRLGGNTRLGVFATRSPFRPNAIGLSSVRLTGVELQTKDGPVLHVAGADLLDGTPIYDIKPYLPYVDSHPEAAGGFAERVKGYKLLVEGAEGLAMEAGMSERIRQALLATLAQDPRPSYQDDPERIYGMSFAGYEVKFVVQDGVLTVRSIMEKQ